MITNFEILRCVVIEDEEAIREHLVEKLRFFPELDIVGEAASVEDAFNLINKTRPDVAFMDVIIEGGNVFDLLNRLKNRDIPIPYTVLATGYDQYGGESFE